MYLAVIYFFKDRRNKRGPGLAIHTWKREIPPETCVNWAGTTGIRLGIERWHAEFGSAGLVFEFSAGFWARLGPGIHRGLCLEEIFVHGVSGSGDVGGFVRQAHMLQDLLDREAIHDGRKRLHFTTAVAAICHVDLEYSLE